MMRCAVAMTPNEAKFAPIPLRGPISEVFPLAHQYGYHGIEVHMRNPGAVDWKEFAALSERHSLPITAIGTGMAARMDGLTLTDDNPDIRRRAVDCLVQYCRRLSPMESSIIIGSMNGNVGQDPDKAKQRRGYHVDCLKECCKTAVEEGVTVLLEATNRYECDWLNTTEDTLDVISQVNSPCLKYLADTFHMNIEEVDILSSIRRAGDRLGYVHLVDSNREGPGRGHIPMKDVIRVLSEIGYDGILSFECLPKPDPETASVESLKHVNSLLSEIQ